MAKKKTAEPEITIVNSVLKLQALLDEIELESVKFDIRDRGWKPAGFRIRKSLKAIADECKMLRKHISEVKRSDLS